MRQQVSKIKREGGSIALCHAGTQTWQIQPQLIKDGNHKKGAGKEQQRQVHLIRVHDCFNNKTVQRERALETI